MTTLAHRGRRSGTAKGIAARRAVVRWGWRMFRREWRQQLLVVTLLTVAVAAAVVSITIVDHLGPGGDPELGSANTSLNFDPSDPVKLEAGLAAARSAFGTIDVSSHRTVAVPGSVATVDYRAQDPQGRYVGELLALRRGTYPSGPGTVAVTDGVAELLGLDIGSTLALDDRQRRVVGIVENPRQLSDEFALVSPSSLEADVVTVLVDSDDAARESFFAPGARRRGPPAFAGAQILGSDHPETKPLAMVSVATVFLLLASLVATAGFAVVAQRRLRQLGMLAAVGATEKQVRLVLLANGTAVGAIAAFVGTAAGVMAWVVFAPTFESALDRRVDRLSLPWWLIAATVVLAVFGATAAAWWPGRAASRLPVMLALSGRPPRPRPARHSAIAAAALIALGVGCLALSQRDRPPLIVAGIVATVVGCLLVGPPAIRIFSRLAGRAPVAPRLALRDLARYQARSGAALAAIALVLGIAATIVVTGAAEEKRQNERAAAELPNLSDRQIRVYSRPTQNPDAIPIPIPTSAQLAQNEERVRELAAGLGQAAVIPLRKAIQSGLPPIVTFDGDRALLAVGLARRVGEDGWNRESGLYVATPAVLRHLGIDPATIDPSADFLADPTVPTDELVILGFRARREIRLTNVQRIDSREVLGAGRAETGTVPTSFVTLNGLRRHGWKQVPAGWLVESSRPLTKDQIAVARDLASEAGLAIETRRGTTSFGTPIAIATAAGAVLALVILALTVGLIRSESARDLRTLAATGATSRIRRTLTAATAGALALLGALLGVAGAYLALAATYHDDLGYLSGIPVLSLVSLGIGVPLVAGAAGWLLGGREPPAIDRPVLE